MSDFDEKLYAGLRKHGIVSPKDEGFFGSVKKGAAQAGVNVIGGIGSTMDEVVNPEGDSPGWGKALSDWRDETLRNNQQWNLSPEKNAGEYIGHALGSGVTQSLGSMAAGAAATALTGGNLAAGAAAGTSLMFGQIYGDRVKEYRERMPDQDERTIKSLAFLSAAGESALETSIGPEALVNGVAKRLVTGALKDTTKSLVKRIGAQAAKSALAEGSEEVAQDLWNRLIMRAGTENVSLPTWEEVKDNFLGGAIPGTVLGGAFGPMGEIQNGGAAGTRGRAPDGGGAGNAVNLPDGMQPDPNRAMIPNPDSTEGRTMGEGLLDEMGIPHSRMTPEEQKTEGIGKVGKDGTNGLFDRKTGEIKINPDNEGEVFSHGHEFDHWMSREAPDVAKSLHAVYDAELNHAGEEYGKGMDRNELYADLTGKILQDPETMKITAARLDEMNSGFGMKFLRAIHAYAKKMMAYFKSNPGVRGAEQYFNDYKRVRDEAASAIAEMKRRKSEADDRAMDQQAFDEYEARTAEPEDGIEREKRNAMETGISADRNGDPRVPEITPLADLNVDPARFQFKGGADEKGVTRPLQGGFDQMQARPLYVWEDKDGKKYVVEGHHRLDLARRSGVKDILTYTDRETEGVTAGQAREKGIWKNIKDGKGSVADFAGYFRKSSLTEEEAQKEGLFTEKEGRDGFVIGKYATENLYNQFKDGDISGKNAAVIADTARGDEGLEAAGIRAAKNGMTAPQMAEFLKVLKNTPREENVQGDLFGFDDSALQTAETLSKLAVKHINEAKQVVNAAKGAVKNPEAAGKVGVHSGKNSGKRLEDAKKQAHRWENWYTDPELSAQLRDEAGMKTAEPEGESPAQTEAGRPDESDRSDESDGLGRTEKPVVKENLTTGAENAQTAKKEGPDEKAETKSDGWTGEKDPEALAERLKEEVRKVTRQFKNLNPETRKDMEQEAWIRAWEARERFNPEKESSPEAFYDTVIRNACVNFLKKENRLSGREVSMETPLGEDRGTLEDVIPAREKNASDILADADRDGAIARKLEGLTDKERELFRMLEESAEKHNGLPNLTEVAKTLGVSTEMVRQRRKKLREKMNDAIQYSVKRVYTGSAADYEKPSLQFVGTGEGAQVFGWGLYGSDNANIAWHYAEADAKRKTEPVILFNGNTLDWDAMYGKIKEGVQNLAKLYPDYASPERSDFGRFELNNAIAGLIDTLHSRILHRSGEPINEALDEAARAIAKNAYLLWGATSPQAKAAALVRDLVASGFITAKVPGIEGKRNLYNQTFWPGKEEDLLNWNEPVTEEQAQKIAEQALKEGLPFAYRDENGKPFLNESLISGEWVYESLCKPYNQLGSPKAVSEFLYRAGIDGVKYPAGSHGQGDGSKGWNYVAFSDQDIQVDEHIQYSIKRSKDPDISQMALNRKASNQAEAVEALKSIAGESDGSDQSDRSDREYSMKRPRQQVNPIREDGAVRDEYRKILEERPYDPKTKEMLNRQAERRIEGMGGIQGTIQAIRDGDLKAGSDVSMRMMQIVLNSWVFKRLTPEERAEIADVYIKAGTEAARALAARRLAALVLDDIESVQAHVNAFLAKIDKLKPDNDLRKRALDQFGIDIQSLPESILGDRKKLDELFRTMAAEKASMPEKFYEFWMNSILSAPQTHAANILGNTANTLYELGLKRFAEAAVNVFAKRKDGATFGEFKAMRHAIDWQDAWKKAKLAFDLESMTSGGKLEQVRTAIGGKTGRIIRTPGRLLRAADEFAKAIIQPIESAAYAYRKANAAGVTGPDLRDLMTKELKDPNSEANQWGHDRALELTFQEDPGNAVNQLIQWRESGGVYGTLLKFILPFARTPANILKQGIRKSPLGLGSLAWETAKLAAGKRKFDGEYVARMAEQVLAWGAVAMLAGMDDDDDDLPFLTGSSAPYGSNEQKWKANRIPPYSIRIGDNYYSYKRIEPLSTGLAFLADGIDALRRAENGEDGTKIMRRLMNGARHLIVEKSFLDSLGQLQKIADDPEHSGMRYLDNFAASWMPGVMKQTLTLFDENVQDNRSRAKGEQWWKDQFSIVTNSTGITKAAPKVDYFGREIKRDSLSEAGGLWPLMRLIPIQSIKPDETMNRAEKLMWNWNRNHPDHEYYPDIPAYFFRHNGEKGYFAGENYHDYAVEAGKLAEKQIRNAFRHGLLNEQNPGEKDIELVKKIFARARKETREKFIRNMKYER